MDHQMRAQKNNRSARLRPARHRSSKGLAQFVAGATGTALFLLLGLAQPVASEEGSGLAQCESIISLEKRLIMERWARQDGCERPVRARFTDRFLGYTCTTEAATDRCHAFVPGYQSRAFDTSQVFRCVDVALTADDDGRVTVNRMREWAAVPKQCDWDPAAGILAMEIDFDNGQVCIGASCMAIDRLTPIGRIRLQRLVTSAFREFGLMAEAKGAHAISPVRAQAD